MRSLPKPSVWPSAWVLMLASASALAPLACGDKPPATPDNNANANGNRSPDAVVIPTQPPANSAATNPNANPDDPPQTEDERAKLREKLDRVAEERDRLERSSRGVGSGDNQAEAGDGKDPLGGKFTLADATASLPGSGALVATIKTSLGQMKCKLFDDKAPKTVANFVGLARGIRPYKSPLDGRWIKQPTYDGTTFHRIIKGFMIQGGDPKGNGTGEPGYVIPDEVWPGAKHDHAGQLCMANRGPNTNGAQFFITDASAPHLNASYTIFGECAPLSVVHAIASVPITGERPQTPVTIDKVEISRDASMPKPPPKPASNPAGPM